MRGLDNALSELKAPSKPGEIIKLLPCDLCGKSHTWVFAIEIAGALAWEIHSPCLDKICKRAVGVVG